MNSHESAARTVTTATLLTGQLDGLMAAWERTVATAHAGTSVGPRFEPAAALADLEHELGALERELADLQKQVDAEVRRVAHWEARAMLADREGRDDLVRQAVHRQQEHRDAADAFATEAAATAEVADAYRDAIVAIRAALPPSTS